MGKEGEGGRIDCRGGQRKEWEDPKTNMSKRSCVLHYTMVLTYPGIPEEKDL